MAGGHDWDIRLSSVLTLLPGAGAWVPIASLPKPMYVASASIVGGRLRMIGGRLLEGGSGQTEVMSVTLLGRFKKKQRLNVYRILQVQTSRLSSDFVLFELS